jgi:hypothetical protein
MRHLPHFAIAAAILLTTANPLNATTLHVDDDACPNIGSGSDFDPYCSIQTALDAAVDGDEIWVVAGIYTPDQGPNEIAGDRNSTFALKNGVALYGGFSGTEAVRDERNPATNITILSGDLAKNDGPNFTNIDENSYHIVTSFGSEDGTILNGFVISGGNADGKKIDEGGGMYNSHTTIKISNCIFSSNRTRGHGGAIFNFASSAEFVGELWLWKFSEGVI